MKKYALIGAAGFVAVRHLRAIKENHGTLAAAFDPHDAVGVLDSHFPDAAFFTEFERFDRHLDKLRRLGTPTDYLSVCSPNYLHDAHTRYGLRQGLDVICEKPLVLNPWNLDSLAELERESGKKVYTILQLRLHPAVQALKKTIENSPVTDRYEIDLTYITARGKWYYASWKGDTAKSGGISTNIGIHLFDMLQWIFGPVRSIELQLRSHDREAGILELERARVRWFLSIENATLPEAVREAGKHSYRALRLNGQEWEFSEGFTDLHSASYREILEGGGFGIEQARPAIVLAHEIRTAPISADWHDAHPFIHLPLRAHPFFE
ncbi:MAG: Gfo/Idh/MocA family oxidoreductase [Saprospiraceae bacterium]